MKILLVDDDRDLVDLLSFALRRAGFCPIAAYDVPSGRRVLAEERPDLAVLDVNLGAESGFDLLRELRRESQLPVVMLSGRDAEDDKVSGLELGADDYLTKPFSHRELIARLRANLRRRPAGPRPEPAAERLEAGPLTLNPAEHAAANDGRRLDLTPTEFRLLHYLLLNAGTVVPTRAILKQVWGYDDPGGADVLRATVHRLRRKLGEDPAEPRLLHTLPGVGIMLKAGPRWCPTPPSL